MIETGYKGGYVLNPGDLPFHLCSMQIFFVAALQFFIKNEQTKEKLLGFMVPSMLLGGIMALLIPTVGVNFTDPQVYQYFIFHAYIIFFAVYVLRQKLVNWSWKTLLRNFGYIGVLAFFVMLINSVLSIGFERGNFMYLVRPPMDNLPILNLDNGWVVYFFSLAGVMAVLLTSFHAIVIFFTNRSNKKK